MPHVFRMAIPMTIGIGAIISFSLADTYFIGLLGEMELAAIGYTFPITTLMFNVIFGMAIAMSAVVSRKIGAGAIEDVRAIVSVGLTFVFSVAMVMSFLTYVLMDKILIGMGASSDIIPIIKDYMNIWLVAAVFLAVPVVANSAIRGMGDAFWPAIVMVGIAVINIILDPILIFGYLGFPAMGIQGAAYASLSAYVIAVIAVFCILTFRERVLTLSCLVQPEKWKMALALLLVIAIPVSLANTIMPIISYFYTAILSELGDYAVAGFGVATRFEAFALIPIMALAGGMAPLIGQNFGAGLTDRVNEAITKGLKFSFFYAVLCALCLFLVAQTLSSIFSEAENVHDFVEGYLIYVPISFIGLNMFLVMTSSMNAMGRSKGALLLNVFKSFVIALPLAWLLTDLYGQNGFFLSVVLTNIAALLFVIFLIKSVYCKANANKL